MTPSGTADKHGSVAERDGLQSALAAAGTGTWRWNVTTGLVRWDPTLEALCGFAPGEFGATYEAWLETLHPDERDGILALVQDALERRLVVIFEGRDAALVRRSMGRSHALPVSSIGPSGPMEPFGGSKAAVRS